MLLAEPQVLRTQSRCDVIRVCVRGGDVPTVILKHFREDPVLGLDEWTGLELLGRLKLTTAPSLIAGDVATRLFLLEDLGTGPSLEDLFNGNDARAASGGLLAVARLAGHMHARTLGVQADFDLIRHTLSPRPSRVRIDNARYLLDHEERLRRWVTATGAKEDRGTHEDLEVVARELANPGPFLSLTHGDMAPGNAIFTRGGPRLLDFEYCGMRHALYDTLMWLLVVPLPDELISRAELTYRIACSQDCDAAQVDDVWMHARACVVVARMVNMFQWISPKALERDREWAPGFSERAALLRHLARCRTVLEPRNPVPSLARTLASLESRLVERWPQTPTFTWPAFR